MIARSYKLSLNNDFERVFKTGRSLYGRFLGVKMVRNNLKFSRFGVILGLKIEKSAVKRHLLKRRIFKVIAELQPKLLFPADYVIIALPAIKEASFSELRQEIINILSKISNNL